MPFNGSGGFQRIMNWQSDAAGGTKIRADRHDQEDDNLASGLSNVICKDGQTQPTANIPMNGKRLVNLGTPEAGSDAATKSYVDALKTFSTGIIISGADGNGRLTFSSMTGDNGIYWSSTGANIVAKLAEESNYPDRLSINSDTVLIDPAGRINNSGALSNNLSYDGATWRTNVAGTGTLFQYTGGIIKALMNDTASIIDNFAVTLREFFNVSGSGGSSALTLSKSGTGKTSVIYGKVGTELRWGFSLGDSAAESGTRTGSDSLLTCYDNDGANGITVVRYERLTGNARFYKDVTVSGRLTISDSITFTGTLTGDLTVSGSVGANSGIFFSDGGGLYLRPNGRTTTTEQVTIDTSGNLNMAHTVGGILAGKGIREHNQSTTGSYGSSYYNFNYPSSGVLNAYIDNTLVGNVLATCDYRIKRDVAPIDRTWDAVKALRPISYRLKDYGERNDGSPLIEASDEVQWGFLAHELQEALLPTAASGAKDAENELQAPNTLAVLAALTAALQEAQVRIEALEARAE